MLLNYLQVPSYRLERFRLHPTFHQRDREDADPLINDALVYTKEMGVLMAEIAGESPETVIAILIVNYRIYSTRKWNNIL